MKEIARNLYQLSQYIPPIEFTIHQYLPASILHFYLLPEQNCRQNLLFLK